jgi:hypothetical protein
MTSCFDVTTSSHNSNLLALDDAISNSQQAIKDAMDGYDVGMDDEELLAELAELAEFLDLPTEAPTDMPAVGAAAEEEDDDARVLRELEASMMAM